jgi:hypothetical protein
MDMSTFAQPHTDGHRDAASPAAPFVRVSLLTVQAFVAVTAIAGGAALIFGAVNAELATVLSPPGEYLTDTPFTSYLVPGIILAVVVGGIHVLGFVLGVSRSRWSVIGAAAAAFAVLIWIFVQMVFIPFSVLQAVYFASGLAEAGLVMLALGILEPAAALRHPDGRNEP